MKKQMFHLLILVALIGSPSAYGAKIITTKGKAAVISLQGTSAKKGDLFWALKGKKKAALLQVTKVSGKKASVRVKKGKAVKGLRVVKKKGSLAKSKRKSAKRRSLAKAGKKTKKRRAKKKKSASRNKVAKRRSSRKSRRSSSSKFFRPKKLYFGLTGGSGFHSYHLQFPSSGNIKEQNISISGVGYTVNFTFDHNLSKSWLFRGYAGASSFIAGGALSSHCNKDPSDADIPPETNCIVDITYMNTGAMIQWAVPYVSFSASSMRVSPLLGLGADFLMPLQAKNTTVFKQDSIQPTLVGSASAGINVDSGAFRVPLQVVYPISLPTPSIQTQNIIVSAGFLYGF